MKYIKTILFLMILCSLFFVSDIVHAVSIQSYNFNEYKPKWQHKDSFEKDGGYNYFKTQNKVISDSSFPINANFAPVTVRSNRLTNFYQWTNSIVYRIHYDIASQCDNKTCKIEGRLFSRDSNYNISDFNYFENSELYFGIASERSSIDDSVSHNEYFQCETTQVRTDVLDYVCYVPANLGSNGYNYLRLELKNKPFTDVSSANDYRENKFYVGVSTTVNYSVLPFGMPKLNVTVNEGTVTLNILNADEFLSDSSFTRFNIRYDHNKMVGVRFSRESTHVFENVPNGNYTIRVAACTNGSQNCGAFAVVKYSVTDSKAPVPQMEITDDNKTIFVDASSSYSYDGSAISKYYYQLKNMQTDEESEWIETTSSTYTFDNQEYGMYLIRLKIEDVNGNVSAILDSSFSHRSPTDKFIISVSEFFSDIKSSISNFFSNLGTFFLRLFIPETHELEIKIDSLQDTLSSKLGFLGESVSFIIAEIEYIVVNPGPFNSICLPRTEMPSEMATLEIIPEGEACLTAHIMNNFNIITSVIKAIMSLFLIGWFTTYCYNELLKILSGSSSVEVYK